MDKNSDIPKGAITKTTICQLYGISAGTLRHLLNVQYFEQLSAVGYAKENRLLSPKQFEVFCSLYGEP